MAETGIVFNVQRFTIHDGPGMRTEFFLKGCPLRCQWCSNPESWAPQPQVGVYRTKCIGRKVCGGCEDSCPEGDIFRFTAGKLAGIDRTKCTDCLACYEECPSDALKQWGRQMTVEECMELIRRDKAIYERSGGGVSRLGRGPAGPEPFCGGPLPRLQGGGLPHLLRVHVLCQLVGGGKGSALYRPHHLRPQADGFCPPPPVYRVGNELILQNLRRLAQEGRELILRIPVIPGVNDGRQNIEASADFILRQLGGQVRTLQLLSFMRLGEEKYKSLGIPYQMEAVRLQRRAFQRRVEEIARYFNSRGIHCLVGTKEKEESQPE